VSNERYPTSSFNRIEVFDALATTIDLKVSGQMQFFVSISSKIDFIQRTMSVSLHRLIRASMGSFPAVFVAPSRNREYLDTFYTLLQRWSLVPIGDQHFAAQPGVLSHPHFLGMGPNR
jgi:hypothetical protein